MKKKEKLQMKKIEKKTLRKVTIPHKLKKNAIKFLAQIENTGQHWELNIKLNMSLYYKAHKKKSLSLN